jgi:glycosyltransferase involved in cell wall biosynthesis
VLEATEGGAAVHLRDVVTTVRGVDHLVVVPSQRYGRTTHKEAVAALEPAGAQVHVIDMRRNPAHPDNAKAMLRIIKLVRSTRPDIVHGHSSVGGALGRTAALTVPGTATAWTPNGVVDSRPVLAIERQLARITSAMIAVSTSEQELMTRAGLARHSEIVVIPNGIDLTPLPAPASFREGLNIAPDTPLIGMVGRLVPQKAPLDFIACCELIARERPEIEFVLIGDGPLRDDVDARLQTWDHGGRFHHIPFLPDASGVVGAFDLFVMLSAYEGAPYAPLEAMRESVPVLLTDVVGSRDTVEDGVSGRLVSPSDPSGAARSALELLDAPKERAAMVQAAHQRLREVFDRELMGAALSNLYSRLVQP